MVPWMSKAAIASGADGLLIEVHGDPRAALSDGEQSLTPRTFGHLMQDLRTLAPAVGRTVFAPDPQTVASRDAVRSAH